MRSNELSRVTLSRKGEASVVQGAPWVFDSEVFDDDKSSPDGSVVVALNQRGKYVCTCFINRKSKIRLRVLTRNANEPVDKAFFERRLRSAVDYRKAVMGEQFSCCRLVFGEADGLPGLTVDRFNDVLVAQTLCLGTDLRKEEIFSSLVDILLESGENIKGIYERNDVRVRELEGLEQGCGEFVLPQLSGLSDMTETQICENGIKYTVDFMNGQKTGFFLDQKFNRAAVGKLAKGRKVLDCFTHTGSFALNCAANGALSVVAADISPEAIDTAKKNAELNGLEEKIEFRCVNVFDMLPQIKPGEFDYIILDPPAFTKSRATIDSALKGYKEINLRALKALPRGGILATCSCSHFCSDELFRKMLIDAASDAGVNVRQIEVRQQAADHPYLWSAPETMYLKFYILQKF